MRNTVWTALLALALPVMAAIVLLFIAGPFWGWVAYGIALSLWVLAHCRHLAALTAYLEAREERPVPDGSGAWEAPFAALYAMQRRHLTDSRQLNTMLDRFQSAAAAMPDAIVILDGDNQIAWCNPVAERFFGINVSQDAGQPITYFLRQKQFVAYLAENDYAQPLKLRSNRHPELTLEIQLIPFGDAQKLVLARDISRFEQLETMRRDFIANVSHELKTPLTVINGFLETIEDMPAAGEDVHSYCGLMLEQSRRMQRLVDALLTLSGLESDHRPVSAMPVDVPALMETLRREAESLSAGRHHLSVEIRSAAMLAGNEDELHSAFSNLITNAIRYTPEGGHITLIWEDMPEGPVFRVRDTGIGVAPEHLNRLTERFYRVDRSRSRETGGTGLGLSIVKHVLTRHRGRLIIDSVPELGSTFSAAFPAGGIPAQAGPETPAE